MADCELLKGCLFFNDQMEGLVAAKDFLKTRYCKGDNSTCARYTVFKALGRPKVPADLFPNDSERAKQIISNG
jgi:hypothetical protein